MTDEKKDLAKLTREELFYYLKENLNKSKKKNVVKKLLKMVKKMDKAN